jgi:hypothetical protein
MIRTTNRLAGAAVGSVDQAYRVAQLMLRIARIAALAPSRQRGRFGGFFVRFILRAIPPFRPGGQRSFGHTRAVVATPLKQVEVIRFYTESACSRIENCGQYAGMPFSVCMSKNLELGEP